MKKTQKKQSQQETASRFQLLRNTVFADRKAAQKLIDDDPSILHARSPIGETALHFLAVENDLDAVRWLAERGADIDTRNDFEGTPLIDAAGLGYTDLCRFLLDSGADIRAQDHNGKTAVLAAARSGGKKKGSPAVLELLLERIIGTDINEFFDDVDAYLTLMHASPAVSERLHSLGLKSQSEFLVEGGKESSTPPPLA